MTTWMALEVITLSEIIQTKKDSVIYIWTLNKNSNSQKQRAEGGFQGLGGGGKEGEVGKGESFQL